ncbi:hypothetical protein V6N13_062476 [Hibiscus sabdariffa]
MVCEKCQKKLSKVIVPDKWKEGASNTNESGGRKINENKLLSKKHRWTPYGNTKCIICKQQVHQDAKYCHTCAYSKEQRIIKGTISRSSSRFRNYYLSSLTHRLDQRETSME